MFPADTLTPTLVVDTNPPVISPIDPLAADFEFPELFDFDLESVADIDMTEFDKYLNELTDPVELRNDLSKSPQPSTSKGIIHTIKNPAIHFHQPDQKNKNQPPVLKHNSFSTLKLFQYEHIINTTFWGLAGSKPHRILRKLLQANPIGCFTPNTTLIRLTK